MMEILRILTVAMNALSSAWSVVRRAKRELV